VDWAQHIGRIYTRLGVDATFTHAGGSPVSVRGFFTEPYALLPNGIDGGMASSRPQFEALTASLGTVALADILAYNSISYVVVEIQPDAPGGFTVLQLQEP